MSPQEAHSLVGHSPAQKEDSSAAGAAPIDPSDALCRAMEWLDRRELVFAKAPLNHASTIKAEIERWKAGVGFWSREAVEKLNVLRAENDRLRIALRAVRASTDPKWVAQIIEDALREKQP